jgi:hypothetical protein
MLFTACHGSAAPTGPWRGTIAVLGDQMRTCVSNRDTDPPIQKLLHAVDILCISYYEAFQRKNRANSWNDCHSRIECLDSKSVINICWDFVRAIYNDCHSRVEVSRQQAQKKKCWDFVHALLELAVWLHGFEILGRESHSRLCGL